MPRIGVRSRLLSVVLPIAGLAMLLTAVVVQRITNDQLQSQVSNDQLVVDSINAELNQVALSIQSWNQAQASIVELAQRFDVRIAITDTSGTVLVDSARLIDNEARPLPTRSAGFIDPFIDAFNIDIPPDVEAEREADLTFEQCLTSNDISFSAFETSDNLLSDSEITAIDACWQTAYADLYNDSFSDFIPEDFSLEDVGFLEPALLFLGEANQPGNVLDATFDYRMFLSILAIGAASTAAVYFLARQILAPISELTRAAKQVASGGRPEPVAVVGDTELSELALAFNSMGDTLRSEEEARRRLTTDIAHELRSPLQNIRGTLESAQDGIRPLDKQLIASVHEEALLLQHLVDDLQVLASADAAALRMAHETLSAAELLATAQTSYADRASAKNIEILLDGSRDVTVFGDPVRLRQVLANLLDNAIRHTAEGGKIDLAAELIDLDGRQMAQITVSDNGEGIPVEFLPHVFERFSRADPSRTRGTGGSGIGLAICHKLIEAHGGTIAVESELGEGTTFTIKLPSA